MGIRASSPNAPVRVTVVKGQTGGGRGNQTTGGTGANSTTITDAGKRGSRRGLHRHEGGGGGGSAGGSLDGAPGAGGGSMDEVDSLSSGGESLKAATANDCGARYILHEEWLADVCGVSRRRLTLCGDEDLRARRLTHPALSISEDDEQPSRDDIQYWSQSFDQLLRSTAGRKVFCDFLRSEYSEDNLLFWMACEDLREEQNYERVKDKAHQIYEDYVNVLSPKEVSLDGRAREIIKKNMQNPTNHAFDDAQSQIYTLMQRDSYPRFLNSKTFAQLQGQQ